MKDPIGPTLIYISQPSFLNEAKFQSDVISWEAFLNPVKNVSPRIRNNPEPRAPLMLAGPTILDEPNNYLTAF